jgi:hypothetical protein
MDEVEVLSEFEKFRAETEASNDPGQFFELAKRYAKGVGTSQNREMAVYWYVEAAELGHTEALYKLSMCYLKGKGVAVDIDKAIALREAAICPELAKELTAASKKALPIHPDREKVKVAPRYGLESKCQSQVPAGMSIAVEKSSELSMSFVR